MGIHDIIKDILNIDNVSLIALLSGIIICSKFTNNNSLLLNIIVTTFVIAIFDLFLKQMLLMKIGSTDNEHTEYYKFIMNNIITIVTIDLLIRIIRVDLNGYGIVQYFNLAFACAFYDLIIYKLSFYNNYCSEKLRNSSKIIMRLVTIHLLSNFLNGMDYDAEWVSHSLSQLFNYRLFGDALTRYN